MFMITDFHKGRFMDEPTAGAPSRAYISEEVLKDEATHQPYMNIMFWTAIAVAIIGGGALVAMFQLAWNGKPIPDGMGNALQWALLILGVLLVGEALLGKVTVTRGQ
jgi:nitrate reductase NapE component